MDPCPYWIRIQEAEMIRIQQKFCVPSQQLLELEGGGGEGEGEGRGQGQAEQGRRQRGQGQGGGAHGAQRDTAET